MWISESTQMITRLYHFKGVTLFRQNMPFWNISQYNNKNKIPTLHIQIKSWHSNYFFSQAISKCLYWWGENFSFGVWRMVITWLKNTFLVRGMARIIVITIVFIIEYVVYVIFKAILYFCKDCVRTIQQ
jgi:hypothetical protein